MSRETEPMSEPENDTDFPRHGGQNSVEDARQLLVRIGALADAPDAMALNGAIPGKVTWVPGDDAVLIDGAVRADALLAIGLWVRRCQREIEGAEAKSAAEATRKAQNERRQQILAAWRAGETQASIAGRFGISRTSVARLIGEAERRERRSQTKFINVIARPGPSMAIDTQGFAYLRVNAVFIERALAATCAPCLSESDTLDAESFTEIAGTRAGKDFTWIPGHLETVFDVDLKGRKRYIRVETRRQGDTLVAVSQGAGASENPVESR